MTSPGITINSDNYGPWINISVWIMMVMMVLASFVKLLCKWVAIRRFAKDDLFMMIAMVSA